MAAFGRNKTHCKVMAVAGGTTSTRSSLCSESRSDYYKVLSLEHKADVGVEDIKRTYRRLALRCHPDVCSLSRHAESMELFLELQRAYERTEAKNTLLPSPTFFLLLVVGANHTAACFCYR
ncbi:hypothetical protein SETIT_3G342700v2 [Setaria italica]|uniref:J domain-containing protein n=1 Tax=Setaria italica TaxID=4555 RepID=A0A368QLS1_SETIT|nr:hypothetical protein SETIT_3G342700v2 [Setaria italica]